MAYRILTISKAYVAAAYRQKQVAFSKLDGVECGLICPTRWDSQAFEEDPASDGKYWIRTLPISFNGKNHFHFYHGIERSIDEFKPDIVNVEEEHYSVVTAQVARICNKRKIPYVFYTYQNIYKRYPPPFCWFERYIFSTCAGAIVGSSEVGHVLRKKGYDRATCEITLGMSWDRFSVEHFAGGKSGAIREGRIKLNLPQDKLIVGYVGRLVEEKGIQDLVEAVALLDADYRRKCRFLILGNGPYQETLEALMNSRGVRDSFELRNFVPSSEVAIYMQAMNALCLPSRTMANWKEQFGRVLVEAMAAETVVIGSSSGEIPHVIGEDGFVFQEKDAQSLMRVLMRCIEQPELMGRLADRAKSKAKDKYTYEAIAKHFRKYFDEILANTVDSAHGRLS